MSEKKKRALGLSLRQFAALLAIASLVIFHATLFRAVGRGLTVDEATRKADVVVVFDGDGRYETAAEMIQRGSVDNVLLIERRPRRLVQMGITPSCAEVGRRQIVQREVPEDRVSLLGGNFQGDWYRHRQLKAWLDNHPQARVVVLCEQFKGRQTRWILNRILNDKDQRRVQVVGLPDRDAKASNWWRNRTGWKRVFHEYFDFGYAVVRGEDEPPAKQLDPDEFETEFVKKWPQATHH